MNLPTNRDIANAKLPDNYVKARAALRPEVHPRTLRQSSRGLGRCAGDG
jgi:hypothetical protein